MQASVTTSPSPSLVLSPASRQRILAREARPVTADQRGRSAVHDRALNNGIIEIPGPAAISFPHLIRIVLALDHDPRKVVGDGQARCFGTRLTDASLTPGLNAHVDTTTVAYWLASHR